MKLIDGDDTVVLVTGSSGAAREKDGPLAFWLRGEIDRRGSGHRYRRAVVVGDTQYVENSGFHQHPTIAIGGPGSNDIAQQLSQILPMVWTEEERSFVQMSTHDGGRQAVLWGMDAEATREAVEAFVREGLLDTLLRQVWTLRGESIGQ